MSKYLKDFIAGMMGKGIPERIIIPSALLRSNEKTAHMIMGGGVSGLDKNKIVKAVFKQAKKKRKK